MPETKPRTFEEVLPDEAAFLARRREALGIADPQPANRKDVLGLAISGGGIRSATFALGVLQMLMERGLLRHVDYLSTVSGGGYIGAWLTTWIRQLGSGWESALKAQLIPKQGRDGEAPPLRWLRNYSNYLSPTPGLFSADTWTIAAIWARNALLNVVLLLSLMGAVLMLPRLFAWPYQCKAASEWVSVLLGVAILSLTGALMMAAKAGRTAKLRIGRASLPEGGGHTQRVALSIAAMLLASAYSMAIVFWWKVRDSDPQAVLGVFIGFGFVTGLTVAACFMEWPRGKALSGAMRTVVAGAGTAIAAAGGGYLLIQLYRAILAWPGPSLHASIVGPPSLLLVAAVCMTACIGIMGHAATDYVREWMGRIGAWVFIGISALIGLFLITFHGLLWCVMAWTQGGVWLGTLGAGWVISALTAIFGGWSSFSSGTGRSKARWAETLLTFAPHAFTMGLAILISAALSLVLVGAPDFLPADDALAIQFKQAYWAAQEGLSLGSTATALTFLLAVAAVLSLFLDINEFSMHYLYRNRLVRCYLAASRASRRADSLTDFDSDDDLLLHEFAKPGYTGPYHLINAALNVSNPEPGQRERRSANFVFSPLYCGYQFASPQRRAANGNGAAYRPTREFAAGGDEKNAVSLGMAFTISGAAATPNMGFHTSAPLAFLMTIFNVRLGWWIGNPATEHWQDSTPVSGVVELCKELLALADDKSNYVYLSDGGHFENLGVYELLRRQCRFIICCDGSQDENFRFDELGGLVRKARTDFGAEIEIDTAALVPDPETRLSRAHCAVGSIRYSNGSIGTLLYLKASLTGDEDLDVLQYRAAHPEFPHQTTSDQFFSESQFESYRKLGNHVAREALQPATFSPVGDAAGIRLDDCFMQLRQAWRGTPVAIQTHSAHYEQMLQTLFGRLREDPDLRFLDAQFYPEWRQIREGVASQRHWWPANEQTFAKAFYLCQDLIQLMDRVHLDLDLESNEGHPVSNAWLNRFMHWSGSDMLRLTYSMTACTLRGRFRSFCKRILYLSQGDPQVTELSVPYQADYFNDFEREQLAHLANLYPAASVWRLSMCLAPLFEGAGSSGWEYTIGYAITSAPGAGVPRRLHWIRIQNHLRSIGLGRQALQLLHRQCGGIVAYTPRLEADEMKPVMEEGSERSDEWVRGVIDGFGVANKAASSAANAAAATQQRR